MKKAFALVVAATKSWGIGRQGVLPWRLPADMAFFRKLTSCTTDPNKRNAVIMGRKTWESIPLKFKPLPQRTNIVLTSQPCRSDSFEDTHFVTSFEAALNLLESDDMSTRVESVFVIGGAQVYKQALNSTRCQRIYLTEIDQDVECDTFFNLHDALTSKFKLVSRSAPHIENGLSYCFAEYESMDTHSLSASAAAAKIPSNASGCSSAELGDVKQNSSLLVPASTVNVEEQQYLSLTRDIIETGVRKGDRTGTGTISKFGCSMRFNLRNGAFPLLTTKRVFFRGVAEELLWFISGSTNAKILSDKGIKIWEGNASRAYLDSIGLADREENDLGPVYGFQWRHFGAEYTNMHADYRGKGVDQLAAVINTIMTKPDDRRIILSAWNPADLALMALPPCHMFCQFYVANGELSCQMYQRSCDMGLGVPFNIASYALLTRMIAQVCNLEAGDFIHVLGDAHVYSNHVEPLRVQLARAPRPFPKLTIDPSIKHIDQFKMEHFQLHGYDPHGKIEMEMAV